MYVMYSSILLNLHLLFFILHLTFELRAIFPHCEKW